MIVEDPFTCPSTFVDLGVLRRALEVAAPWGELLPDELVSFRALDGMPLRVAGIAFRQLFARVAARSAAAAWEEASGEPF